MVTILVAEDDRELLELFRVVLREKGYQVLTAQDGQEALEVLEHNHVDLLISDVMMPRLDGYGLTQALRDARETMPILLITAKQTQADKWQGFRAGTDDYMVKPVDVNEMLWRVEALLRRSRINQERRTVLGETVLDCDTLTVTQNGQEISLPQKEFYLLFKLAASPNRIFTRRQLMDEIWGVDSETGSHSLDVHINRLRERFKNNRDFSIVTVRGLGYKVVESHG